MSWDEWNETHKGKDARSLAQKALKKEKSKIKEYSMADYKKDNPDSYKAEKKVKALKMTHKFLD